MCIKQGTSSGFKFTRTKLIILIFYNHDGTALCLPVILVSLVVLALLALLAAFVSLVAVVLFLLLFALCLLPFCVTTAPTYRLIRCQPHVSFSLGSSTTRSTIDAGSTCFWSDSIWSQGYVMDCFFAFQRSFLSCNRWFQCIIGIRVRPLWVHYLHVQGFQSHYSVQAISLPHQWWIWKGFRRP